ncbi:hypothetical protein LTR95_013217 [Oleoguttula sp. CCFEE 5521]
MAAFDTPWTSSMTDKYGEHGSPAGDGDVAKRNEPATTVAAFAPNKYSSGHSRSQSSVLIHQKSPLLLATPPQVTRALAYSHPFILPLNHIAGLLSWTTGDPWESFLLVAGFWFTVLYNDVVLRYGGPLVLMLVLILGMYTRRYSPLSSTIWSGDKRKGKRKHTGPDNETEQRKSLDEILETMQSFTNRCNILLGPFLRLTDFLSTQTTATAATTRPALTTLFIRILVFTPVWILLTLPPLHILTSRRVLLALGTLALSWHSRPARVTRTILWRSRTIRTLTTLITGLQFSAPPLQSTSAPPLPPRTKSQGPQMNAKPGVRFTFTLFENQRRWLGLGWTANLLTYERQAWTDEHLNPTCSPQSFALPSTETSTTRWQWVDSSSWRVEGAATEAEKSAKRRGGGGGGDESGWTYYDTKWRDGRKTDGWGRYTRRRKWVRDAELVEVPPPSTSTTNTPPGSSSGVDMDSVSALAKKRGWFGSSPRKRTGTLEGKDKGGGGDEVSAVTSVGSGRSRDGPEEDVHTPVRFREREWEREIGEGLAEGLG